MEHFRIKARAGVKVIEPAPLVEAGFLAGFSTRTGGVSPLPDNALNLGYFSGDARENVKENRARFLAALAPTATHDKYPLVTAKQIHSAESHVVINIEEAVQTRVS